MWKNVIRLMLTACVVVLACSCRHQQKQDAGTSSAADGDTAAEAAVFSADSAMKQLRCQVDFGPRVPGSEAHEACAGYLEKYLREQGADTVMVQRVEVKAWNGDVLPLRNIYARFNSKAGGAPILLSAHWDSRPWADAESDAEKRSSAIDGANDGASGVAVLLEIARLAGINGTVAPLDIFLADGEDYGSHDDHGDETSWCLGTQAWLEDDPYYGRQRPRYAILLDMVGGREARFHREYISNAYAPGIVDRVWNRAASLGLAERFVSKAGGAVVDDHLFLNRYGIPSVDIIESLNPETGSFNPTWHTHDDTYENIDPLTIADVGKVVSSLVIKP